MSDDLCKALEERGENWESFSEFKKKTLLDNGFSYEMCKFVLDNWREYKGEDIVLFNSYNPTNMVLSNMFPFVCKVDNKVFNSVDHLFHYLRAKELKDDELIKIICKSSGVCSGYNSKRDIDNYFKKKGYSVRETSVDKLKCNLDRLRYCWEIKAKCCRDYYDKMIESKDKILCECSPWSGMAGVCYNSDKKVYEGVNIVGRYMNRFKNELVAAEESA